MNPHSNEHRERRDAASRRSRRNHGVRGPSLAMSIGVMLVLYLVAVPVLTRFGITI